MPSPAHLASDIASLIDSADPSLYDVATTASGADGSLPLTDEMLRVWPSGDLFGLSQNAGMGWNPSLTAGDVREPDGRPIALGYHTGHFEISRLVEVAARELTALGAIPFAGAVSDPCDGRTQGTSGMFDSLPYRNDAAIVLRRLVRSLPRRRGILGVATCDKGLPAMMLALAGCKQWPSLIVPGGVSLPPKRGEDAGKIQTIGVRYVHAEITLQEAADAGCRACATPGGGCQFLGTAATSQVVAEALGWTVPHAALAPSGQPIWEDVARRSALALVALAKRGRTCADVLTDASIRNAMAVHAAFGGSTNLLLHIPAIAFAAGLARPTAADWLDVNRRVPRLVSVLPNGPEPHTTVRAFLAGGVPEVMLHLRELNLIDGDLATVSSRPWNVVLDGWANSERRKRLRERLHHEDGVDPDDVIMPPARAAAAGLTPTIAFPTGNLAPEGSVIKATSIDPSVVAADGIYRKVGPARVFTRESDAIAAIKGQGCRPGVSAGDVVVLIGRGPMGSGMEETYQLTSALKQLAWGKHVALLTDARFSGVSTGACVGHIGPEALAGGPIGRLRDGDLIRIVVDRAKLDGTIDLIGVGGVEWPPGEVAALLDDRPPHPDLAPDPDLPADTRLWAALQAVGGGTWGGCVYDPDAILAVIEAGKAALAVERLP